MFIKYFLGVLDWADRGTADGGSPDSQKGSRSPHIQTTVGVSVSGNQIFRLVMFMVFFFFFELEEEHVSLLTASEHSDLASLPKYIKTLGKQNKITTKQIKTK